MAQTLSTQNVNQPRQQQLRIVMLGWEFPPHVTGGLGAACEGLVRSLSAAGHHVRFMLPVSEVTDPSAQRNDAGVVRQVPIPAPQVAADAFKAERAPEYSSRHVEVHRVPSRFVSPYTRPQDLEDHPVASSRAEQRAAADQNKSHQPISLLESPAADQYRGDLFAEADRFAARCVQILSAEGADFDLVHAHDWLTFRAGLAIGKAFSLPVVLHVHSMERDRCPGFADQRIEAIERESLHAADHVITVSNRTRDALIETYNLSPGKISVAHNGIDFASAGQPRHVSEQVSGKTKTVLFVGRMTEQKGAGYLLQAASLVTQRDDSVRFVFCGSGDTLERLIERSAQMRLGRQVLFTGHLKKDEVERAMRAADLLVMPSVSEPFGLVALEAVRAGLPVILSTTAGAAEVLHHSLKVDYWDSHALADRILSVLHRPALAELLRSRAQIELTRMTWRQAAAACVEAYSQIEPA